MAYKDIEASRAAIRKHYAANRQYYKDRNARRRLEIRTLINKQKDTACKDCHIKYPPYVMHFDHLDDKLTDVAKIVTRGWGLKRIMQEIAKCEVVCANCHAERTHKRRVISSTDRVLVFETKDVSSILT